MSRAIIPLKAAFFNDGYWYVLSSTSLGGGHLSSAQIADRLQSGDEMVMNQLLQDGICLPLYFPGDCALDDAIIVVGDLTEQEEAEWIGRLRSKLEIPCGEFLVMGGGLEEDFDIALSHFNPPDPHYTFFQKFKVQPGTYTVEVYAYVSSMTVNFAWEDLSTDAIEEWWQSSRPGQDYPDWLIGYLKEGYVDSDDYPLVEYIIRLMPFETEMALPELEEDTKWCGVFDIRRPERCPLGISRNTLTA